MTIHSSLKTKSGALSQHRNVLKRSERIAKLSSQEKFDPAKQSPLGIVKVRNVNTAAKKGKTEKAGEGADAKAPAGKAAAKPAAGAAKPAAGGKAAAPAAGAKAAAPAAGAKKK
jgi:small basic protein (TIGR04137 family)